MTVSMYAEPAEYAVGPGGAELTKSEARELALGLVDAIAIFDEENL